MSRAERRRRSRGAGCVFLKKGTRFQQIKYYVGGKPVFESTGTEDRREAERMLRERIGAIAGGTFAGPDVQRTTIGELCDGVLTDYRTNGKANIDHAERYAKRMKKHFGEATKAHTVKTDAITRYIEKRQAEGAENSSVNREMSFLKRAFNLGIRAEKIIRKPYIPKLDEDNVRTGFFERGDFLAFHKALPEYLQAVATFAYYTGTRRGEIFNLKWLNVDLAAQTVRFDRGKSTKNRKGRVIALAGELLHVIKAQWEKRKVVTIPGHSPAMLCPYVFHRNGKKIGDPRKAWDKAIGAASIARRTLHDFRRTAVRDMTRAGVPETVAMAISGHKTRSVFDRYNVVSEGDLKQAAQRHAAHVEEQEQTASITAIKSA